MHDEQIYWHCFNKTNGLGPKNFEKLYGFFDSLKTAWLQANISDFQKAGLPTKLILEILDTRPKINTEKEAENLEKEKIKTIIIKNKNYPERLKQIYDPPALLYVKGDPKTLNGKYLLAIVGSRKNSSYGQRVCHQLVSELSQAGLTTVSGLAIGCDSLVHQVTLENNGQTIAVVGSGINHQNIYPHINKYLAQQIIANNGAVISEYPPDEKAQIQYFPLRNRIISGLSLGTLIIEAGKKSGALITAYSAVNQNREVFAAPGSIYNQNSQGTNQLIQKGAKLVLAGQDILDELCLDLELVNKKVGQEIDLDPAERIILNNLDKEELHVDKISQLSKFSISQTNSILLTLEVKNLVKNLGNQTYIKI